MRASIFAAALLSLCTSQTALAQPGQPLDEARDAFVAAHAALERDGERYGPGTTTGDRLRRETAAAALAFAELGEAAIAEGDVPPPAHATAWDDVLTARQTAAVPWLELGECDTALDAREGADTTRFNDAPAMSERTRHASWAMWGVTAGAAAGAVTLLVVERGHRDHGEEPAVSWSPTLGGASLRLHW